MGRRKFIKIKYNMIQDKGGFLFIVIRVYDQIIHSILPFVNSLRISFIILSYTLTDL